MEGINDTATNNSWDYSGYGNNGSADLGDNIAIWNSSGGYDGKGAYKFNGTSYISLGAAEKYFPTANQKFTFSLRFRIDECSPDAAASRLLAAPNFHISLGDKVGNTCTFRYSDGTLTVLQPAVSIGAWHHLATLYNGSDWLNYIDGQPATSGNRAGSLTAGTADNIFLGKVTGAPVTNFFNGTIDEVMFFNRSLSAEQIHALFNNRTDLIAGQELRVNDVWSVQVTPNDGSADGGMLQSNNVTILDKTPPFFVNITNPVNSSNFSAGMQAFNATVLDTESDLSRVLFMFNTNATPFNATAVNRSGNWGALVNLTVFPEGLHSAIVFANDTVDNINNTINISFTVDLTAPNVSITAPATGRNFSLTSPLQDFNATVRDNITVIDTVIFQFSNGTSMFNRTATNTSGTWNVSGMNFSSFIEGIQTATVFANDTVNNVNNTINVSFTIDRTAPVVVVDCAPYISSVVPERVMQLFGNGQS